MGIGHHFLSAQKFIGALEPQDRQTLSRICRQIQGAENTLLNEAEPLFGRCKTVCLGICCRNVQLEAIINELDMVYLLTVVPEKRAQIAQALTKEVPFFSADCIFLENGEGPCIFPPDSRPEKCLISFCMDTSPVRSEIARVRRAFFKLHWFWLYQRPKTLARRCAKWFKLRNKPCSGGS